MMNSRLMGRGIKQSSPNFLDRKSNKLQSFQQATLSMSQQVRENPNGKSDVLTEINQRLSTTDVDAENLKNVMSDHMHGHIKMHLNTAITPLFTTATNYTGGYVKVRPELKSLPFLERKGRSHVYMYHFVDVINGLIDYDEVIDEYPGLSYSQINGAFGFIRRLLQFNTAMVDVDAVENEFCSQDQELIADLRRGFGNGEPNHVLTAG